MAGNGYCPGKVFWPLGVTLYDGRTDGESMFTEVFVDSSCDEEGLAEPFGRVPFGRGGDDGLADGVSSFFSLNIMERSQWTLLFCLRFFKKAEAGRA